MAKKKTQGGLVPRERPQIILKLEYSGKAGKPSKSKYPKLDLPKSRKKKAKRK